MSWESSEGEERVSCRKQAETRTNQIIKQQQETIGKLQEDVQFLTQHYDPSVIPTDGFTVSARYRLIAEATEKEREGGVDLPAGLFRKRLLEQVGHWKRPPICCFRRGVA